MVAPRAQQSVAESAMRKTAAATEGTDRITRAVFKCRKKTNDVVNSDVVSFCLASPSE